MPRVKVSCSSSRSAAAQSPVLLPGRPSAWRPRYTAFARPISSSVRPSSSRDRTDYIINRRTHEETKEGLAPVQNSNMCAFAIT